MRDFIAWNPPLSLALIALVTVQLFKVVLVLLVSRKLDFRRVLGAGGMPSSHAASVSALATAVGLQAGWNSPLFGIAAFFSIVVMYDAAGIRHAVGRQAAVLNQMLEDLRADHSVEGDRLIELLGHTPLEVFVGAAYGVVLVLALFP